MSKNISGKDGPTLGLETSADMYKKLQFESSRLQKDWLNRYDTFNFLVTAWHLCNDWTKSTDTTSLSRKKRDKNKLPKNMQLVLSTIRDLCNGSKHFNLNNDGVKNRVVTDVHTNEITDWYGYFFHETVPGVTVNDSWYFNIRTLHNFTMQYYEWVFNDNVAFKNFPAELNEAISFCHIPSRDHSQLSNNAKEIIFRDYQKK